MYRSTLNPSSSEFVVLVVLLTTGLIAISDGNQGNQQNGARYNRGVDCRFIYASLKYVCAQGAGITVIPSPCCISQVRYLEIIGNPLTSLRKRELSRRFSKLYGLDLRNNQINRIYQGAFVGLKKLQVLDLSGNRLTSLPDGVFKGLSSLTTLHLGDNGMVSMHQGAFSGLSFLSILRLNNNNLQEIREEAFEPLERLLRLYLDANQLSSLETDSFSGLRRLQVLSLTSNQLQTIPDILRELPELMQLTLNNNPLVCDCKVVFLRRWLVGHSSRQSGDMVLCTSPQRFRGLRLTSISPWILCQSEKHPPTTNGGEPSEGFPRYDHSFSDTTSVIHQDHGASVPGGNSYPATEGTSSHSVVIDIAPGVNSTPSPTETASASQRTDRVFFNDIPGFDHGPTTTPNAEPGIPFDPGHGPPEAPMVPFPVTRPSLDSGRPGMVTPNPRPGHPLDVPGGRPTVNDPNPSGPEFGPDPSGPRPPGKPSPSNPQGPTSGYGWTAQGPNPPEGPNLDPGGNTNYPGQPTVGPERPSTNPNGSSSNPNGTSLDNPGVRPTGSSNQPNNPSGQPYDSDILSTLASVTGNTSIPTESVVVVEPSGDNGATGGSSSGTELPNAPLVVYGVDGQSVVLFCETEEFVTKPRVNWLLPNGRPITGLNSRFKLKADGSLRIKPLRRSDVGSYRCIVRSLESSKVILVRLRAACPCKDSASSENYVYDDLSPVPYPVLPYDCSWTPLVIAVVTTFQGTVAACALVFCIWYTRCHRRKTFTIRVEEAEKRDSKRLRNSDMSVLRECPNSTITSLADSSRSLSTSFEQGSLHPCDSLSAVSPRTSHTLSDYMNAYVTQQMRRQQYQLRVPIPDYVDLDPNSRDRHETLYSSLRGRDFNNRRRRIVTQ